GARQMRSRRLARRGLVLSAGALAAALARNDVLAQLPPVLGASLTRVAPLVAAGQTAASGALSARVIALSQGVLKAMLLSKLKIATALFLVLALLAVGATFYPTSASPHAGGSSAASGGTAPKNTQADKPAAGAQPQTAPAAPPQLPAVPPGER